MQTEGKMQTADFRLSKYISCYFLYRVLTISWILQFYKIRVVHKPTTMLQHVLTNVEDRDEP